MKIKYRLMIATVILLSLSIAGIQNSAASQGYSYACNEGGCHAYSPQLINITTDINSIIVSPNEPFVVNISWSGGNPSGVTEINWPTNFANIAITRDNTLFNPNPRIPASVSNTPSGTTNSTLTAPQTPGTYTVRVYASRKSSLETDYKDITVIVQASYNVRLSVDSNGKTTSPGINATYRLTINNTGDAPDNYTLVVSNPDSASVGLTNTQIQNLAAGANTTVLLNVTNATAGTFRVNVTANSTGDPSKIAIVNTTTTVSVPSVYGVSLSVDPTGKTTSPGVNATYKLTINNSGSTMDNYSLVVSNPDGAKVGLGNTQIQNLAVGANATVLLNVTHATAGTFRVNVTASSTGNPNKTASVNTTTVVKVPSIFDISLSVDSTGKTTSPGLNATYKLTINNSGSTMDNYTLVVSNPYGAAVGLDNTQIRNLAAGANAIVLLNVTNTTAGTFRVNVTARSTGDPNRTASVNTSTTVRVLQTGGAPHIISYSPKNTFVKNKVGDQGTFYIKLNTTANVTWYIYDFYGLDLLRKEVFSQIGVNESSYTNTSAARGIWIVKAIASNQNGTDLNTWMWFVSQKPSKDNETKVRIEPRTLNLGSKGKFTAFISLAEGYDVANINISTLECEGAHALKGEVKKNGNVLQVKFNRQDLVNVSPGKSVRLTVTGMFNDGITKFEGSDVIRVINNSRGNDDEEDDEDESEADDDNEDEKEGHSDKVKSDSKGQGKNKDSDKVKSDSRGQETKKDSDKVKNKNKGQEKKTESDKVKTNSKGQGKKLKNGLNEDQDDNDEDED